MRACATLISARGRSMLKLENLSCGYGAIRAVENLSIAISAGSMLALLGPNGAGTTSTRMAIMDHTTAHHGRILFEGRDLPRAPPVAPAPVGSARGPQGRRLCPSLPAW